MLRDQNHSETNTLIFKLLENCISDKEIQQLDELFSDNPDLMNHYCEYVKSYTAVRMKFNDEINITGETTSDDRIDEKLWLELAEYAETASKIEIPSKEPEPEPAYEPATERSSKLSISVILSIAALLFIVLFIYLVPPVATNIEVVTLTGSVRAKWADMNGSMQNGARLLDDGTPLQLYKGLAELQFDNSARVVIEGPAEFRILAEDRIGLQYGKIYATVPQEAIGFSIYTKNAKVIDLGTEFGVQADSNGDTHLHVIKGKTTLIAGEKSDKVSMEVGQGVAKKISAISSIISDIRCNTQLFARAFDSDNNIVWREQPVIDLADIVGGGNGFKGGVTNAGIDTTTGKIVSRLSNYKTIIGSVGYKTVYDNPYIDGVFIPGAGDGNTLITSEGSCTVLFPKTSGGLWGYIFNGAFHQGSPTTQSSLQLGGVVFGTPDNPAITIHSNQGITFDLSKIRKSKPELSITGFRSLAGVSQTVHEALEKEHDLSFDASPEVKKIFDAMKSKVEFWVFLDGKEVFHATASSASGASKLYIPITEKDKFLTLAVTESDDTTAYDWALFARPELIVDYK